MGIGDLRDLSAGQWRQVIPGAAGEVANPGHERIKLLGGAASGERFLLRYAGLGSWGTAAVARARALAEAGIAAEVVGEAQGFLALSWIAGGPATRRAAGDRRFVAALETYLARRAPLFRTGEPSQVDPIMEMLRTNAEEALGPKAPGLSEALGRLERLPERAAVVPDARLQPREWVCTRSENDASSAGTMPAYVKVDAIDHGDGLRLPGPTDVAWDVAGAVAEFGLDAEVAERLVARCAASTHESAAALAAAVAAYRAPYAACALGDALLASWEATTDHDKRLLAGEAARYRALLERELLAAVP
jgi:hypothetical protein